MSHSIEFDPARKRITIVVAPPVSAPDALECLRTVRTHPEFSADYGILINSLAEVRPPTAEEAMQLGGVLRVFFPNQRIAWVRSSAHVNTWAEAISFISNATLDVGNFSDLSAAEVWLAR